MWGKGLLAKTGLMCVLMLTFVPFITPVHGIPENSFTTKQLPTLNVNVTLNETVVNSGSTLKITVTVTSGGTGIEGVYVEFWLSQEGGIFTPPNCTTDSQGKAETILKTPISQVTLVCSVSVNAAKEGYESGMNTAEFTLLPLPKLEVNATANVTQIYNNQSVQITVYVSYAGQMVKNATVRMALGMGMRDYGEEYFSPSNGTTDAEGKFICVFSPPVVTNETEFGISISAYADGYTENTTTLVVKVLPEQTQNTNQDTKKTPDGGILIFGIAILVAVLSLTIRGKR
ncbi:MAG: hypothetical protein ACP5LE_02710 [Thermoplasmata archaeon]